MPASPAPPGENASRTGPRVGLGNGGANEGRAIPSFTPAT